MATSSLSDTTLTISGEELDSTTLGYLNGVTSDVQSQLGGKQDTLSAGTNVQITGTTISATDTNTT